MLKSHANFLFIFCFISIIQFINTKYFHNIYHTGEEIFSRLDFLADNSCQNILQKKTFTVGSNAMKYYLLSSPSKGTKQNVYILFGEHSRELISPELGLFFIEALCGESYLYDKETINKMLEQNNYLIVPIVNVPGKIAVENGDFCKRTNENGVDLNRNWDSHFNNESDDPDQFSGKHAFSEWQTRVLKKLLVDFKPRVFISVHSGALGMYSPPAYKIVDMKTMNDKKFQHIKNLIKILNILNEKYCNCKAGPAANELWYVCPGNCLDYAYEKEVVPYSFAFEIFTNQKKNKHFNDLINAENPAIFNYKKFINDFNTNQLSSLFIQKSSSKLRNNFLQIDGLAEEKIKHHNHSHENSEFSCFAQTSTKFPRNKEFCMHQFNPLTQKHKDNTVINWTNVFFELTSLTYELDKKLSHI
jgi:hypothetical protein